MAKKITDEQFIHIHDNSLSVKDAAKAAGCSESTVRTYRRRAAENVASLESLVKSGVGEQDDTTGEIQVTSVEEMSPETAEVLLEFLGDPTFIDDAENLTIPAEGAFEAFVASYQASRCGHVTTGGKFMCGLRSDHQARNMGHCHGIPVPA